jgi:hypothetical protein
MILVSILVLVGIYFSYSIRGEEAVEAEPSEIEKPDAS